MRARSRLIERPRPTPSCSRVNAVHLDERLEDRLELVLRDAAAGVDHVKPHGAVASLAVDADRSAGRRELDRVRDEVDRICRVFSLSAHDGERRIAAAVLVVNALRRDLRLGQRVEHGQRLVHRHVVELTVDTCPVSSARSS